MDYLREINAFYDFDYPSLLSSQSAICLYKALLHTANRSYWKKGFQISDSMLMVQSKIKDRRTFKMALAELTRNNLVVVEHRENGCAYTICGIAIRPAKTATMNAARNDTPGRTENVRAEQPSLIAVNNPCLSEKTALNPASIAGLSAGSSTHKSRSLAVLPAPQTKQNKQKEIKKESASADETIASIEHSIVNKRPLIIGLVEKYHKIEGVHQTNGDYGLIGSMLENYGYQKVHNSILKLAVDAGNGKVEKPLAYLLAILKSEACDPFLNKAKGHAQYGEEDSVERFYRERYRG